MNPEVKPSKAATGSEPSVQFAPVPVGLFLLLGVLFYFGQLYLDRYSGGFNAKVYEPYESWKMIQDLQPKDESAILVAKGMRVYTDAGCAACHQATGTGAAGIAPPLVGSEWVLAEIPNRIIRIVHGGMNGPITVKGVQYSNLAMPAQGRDLKVSDEDLAAVLTYIRGNKEWGNSASLVTPEQVKAVRDQIKDRTDPWTATELIAIPDK